MKTVTEKIVRMVLNLVLGVNKTDLSVLLVTEILEYMET